MPSNMMSVNRRLAHYRVARGYDLTPAQRRRVRKAMNRWAKRGRKHLGMPS